MTPRQTVESNLQQLWASAVSDKTYQVYMSGFKVFQKFMDTCVRDDHQCLPPLSEHTLLLFVTYCYRNLHLRYATIKSYLCGVRFVYMKAGVDNPWQSGNLQRLQTIVNAVKKDQCPSTSVRLPITAEVLSDLCGVLGRSVFPYSITLMMKAVCCLAFFAFLRCGEFTCDVFDPEKHLCMSSVVFNSDYTGFTLLIKASKTDPFRHGVTLTLHKVGNDVCPVNSMLQYLSWRSAATPPDDAPLFVSTGEAALSRNIFLDYLRTLLVRAGYNHHSYNGHSFRIGAATTAAKSNIPDHLIQTMGRWSSQCYTRYIRTAQDSIARAQRHMSGDKQ